MKRLVTILMLSMFCFPSLSLSTAPSTKSRTSFSNASNAGCEIKFHSLSRYKSNGWSRIFSDREVAPALRTLLKSDYGLLKESLKQPVQPEDSDSFMDKNGVLTFEGGVEGLYTLMEAKLVVEPCGNIYAAILDNGERFLYFSSDQKYVDKLPPAIEQWRASVESRRSRPSEVPKLPVVFKNKSILVRSLSRLTEVEFASDSAWPSEK
jgi:hypothetical protein